MRSGQEVRIGILALQGAFAEHQVALQKLPIERKVVVVQVRTPEDLERCDGLIIPGGESTTIALLAHLAGLLDPLREFLAKKPVWGTCAGAILLSQSVEGTKKGGQELLGGMSITIARNGWGSQAESFEAPLEVAGLRDPGRPFMGVFIRAPVLLSLKPNSQDPPISIVARLPSFILPRLIPPDQADTDSQDTRTVVAIRQGRHFLTTFHPELTQDTRFHDYFLKECVLGELDE